MKLPVQVVFRDMAPLPSLEGELRERAARLDRFAPDLTSCQIVVEASGGRHRQGHRYTVRIDLRLTGAEIVAGEHQADEDIGRAVHGAFDAATRQLEDLVRRRRGQVKQHAPRGEGAPP
ncbi:MAG: ribosome-associated translation inhibitor RaiA [Rubrivivax sp.]|nr:ribosome-associated translation inhibitor RaiA [Rubrivivax sp.]